MLTLTSRVGKSVDRCSETFVSYIALHKANFWDSYFNKFRTNLKQGVSEGSLFSPHSRSMG